MRKKAKLEALGLPGRGEPLFMVILADVSLGKYPEVPQSAKDSCGLGLGIPMGSHTLRVCEG